MKQIKQILSVVLVITLMITGSMAINTTKIMAASNGNGARNAYKSYMGRNKNIKVNYINGYNYKNAQTGKFKTSTKKINLKKFIHYAFVDINKDGVPELFVSNKNRSKGFGKVLICTYKNGKVVPMLCVTGIRTGIYTAKNKQLCIGFGLSDTKTYSFLKVKKSKIVHVNTYRRTYDRVSGGKQHSVSYKNNKKIKGKKFQYQKKNILQEIDV